MRTEKNRKFVFLANPTVGHANFLISLVVRAKENSFELTAQIFLTNNEFVNF